MKFSTGEIRKFLKPGMLVTLKSPVDISREYESGQIANPSDIGKVKGIKCPVVTIPDRDKRRPFDEFVSVEFSQSGAVSYDNIQLLGFLNYLPEQYLDEFLLDAADAHSWRWSGIRETEMEVTFSNYDEVRAFKVKRFYPIGSRY